MLLWKRVIRGTENSTGQKQSHAAPRSLHRSKGKRVLIKTRGGEQAVLLEVSVRKQILSIWCRELCHSSEVYECFLKIVFLNTHKKYRLQRKPVMLKYTRIHRPFGDPPTRLERQAVLVTETSPVRPDA